MTHDRFRVAAAIALTGVVFNPAMAQQVAAVPEQVIITARPPDPVGNAAFDTTVLSDQQLEISPRLDTALRQVPGLSLFHRNTSLSTNVFSQAVSLRSIGASGAGRALVTLDGVPQNDPFGQWVVWSSLPAEDIQSAEIVKGAGAGPYGAGALTGVIALSERAGNSAVADAEGGEIREARVAAAGNQQYDNVSIGASAMYMSSGGWIPVRKSQRGAADTPLSLRATGDALHGGVELSDGTQITGRVGYYQELRNTELVGGYSNDNGTTANATISHSEAPGELGWRLQGWMRDTSISNFTVALGARRATTTPASFQYAVPALGWGVNAAVRGSFAFLDWEAGGDVRLDQGESQELFSFSSGQFHNNRFAGGRTFIGGGYLEGASHFDDWLITAGVRVDEWRNYQGHIVEHLLATGAVTNNIQTPDASGTLPTARGAVRRDIEDGLFLRTAGYIGFRPPSLNELFRAFRSGNNYLAANSGLKPEKLYGAEIGAGEDKGPFTWDVTGFWNQIADAVTLVTVANGPGTFPGAGFLPAGGQFQQRQNVGKINAYGVEGEAQYQMDAMLALRGGFDLTDAHVEGGRTAPQLTGKRPQQTPRWTVTAGVVATPVPLVTLEAYLLYESMRWSDDLNTLPLGPATTVDVQASFHVLPMLDVYAAVDNVLNAEIQTGRGADQVVSIDAPRLFRAGIRYRY